MPEPIEKNRGRNRLFLLVAVAVVAAVAAAGAAALAVNIMQKKEEARHTSFRVTELTDETVDPAVWGKNFPFQYDGYKKTVDMVRTKFGGSEAVPRAPTDNDPRTTVAQSRLDEDPRLRTFWNGYAFAVDFREERGHAYMLEDQTFTERQVVVQQPGTCMHCHGSVYVPYKKLGNGDLIKGFEAMNQMKYQEARKLVEHPVTCIDCHDPSTLQLRVTRPGFLEGMKNLKASQGITDYDVNRDATRQEMRTYVCGQCHVEYYFKGPEKRLTYPWHKGLKVENMLDYYEEVGFKDWTHKQSGAPVLKAQHPEFELYNQGVHARSGVACADCHMPYMREGAMKVSDHHVRSPLLMLNRACQTCHRWPEEELQERVHTIQARTYELRNRGLDAVVALIADIEKAKAAGKTDEELKTARMLQRRAQFMVDFIEAENSMGFHADQEAARVLGVAVDLARQGQIAVRDPSFQPLLVSTVGPMATEREVTPMPAPSAGTQQKGVSQGGAAPQQQAPAGPKPAEQKK